MARWCRAGSEGCCVNDPRHVTVVGSINVDLVARVSLHPKIGETVVGQSLRYVPGGKGANQAVAAARVGASSSLVAKLGNDAVAEFLLDFLRTQRVDVSHVTRPMLRRELQS